MTRFARLSVLTALLTALAIGMAGIAPRAAAADSSIACVNMEKMFDNYYKTMLANKRLQDQREAYRKYILEQQEVVKKMEADFSELRNQSQNIALSEDARKRAGEQASMKDMEVTDKKRGLVAYSKEKMKDLMSRYEDERKQILQEISGRIQDESTAKGYTMVFDISGNTSNKIPTVIYHKPELDITESLLAELNKGHEEEVKTLMAEQDAQEAEAAARAAAAKASPDGAAAPGGAPAMH